MFKAHILEPNGDVAEEFENCIRVMTLIEPVMRKEYPDIYEAIGMHSHFIQVTDSTGNHFFPTELYSVVIG